MMPTYTYSCKQCNHRFDQRQSFTDEALTVCPVCAGDLRKVLNSVGVVFKGSGFYRTDSRSSGSGGKSPAGPAKTRESSKPTGETSKPVSDSSKTTSGTSKPTAGKTPVGANNQ
jgi:putative FmdB family regulatory protein